jgi:hypothetical protein
MLYISITELQSNGHISDKRTGSFKLVPSGSGLYSFGLSIPAQCVVFFVPLTFPVITHVPAALYNYIAMISSLTDWFLNINNII